METAVELAARADVARGRRRRRRAHDARRPRRTATIADRIDARYQVPDTFALFQEESSFEQADAILASPLVEKGDRVAAVAAFTDLGYLPLIASVDGRLGVDMHFNRVERGRRPDPGAPFEVAIPKWVAAEFGLDIGDTIPFHSASRDQRRCLFAYDPEAGSDPECDAINAIFEGSADWSVFEGPNSISKSSASCKNWTRLTRTPRNWNRSTCRTGSIRNTEIASLPFQASSLGSGQV